MPKIMLDNLSLEGCKLTARVSGLRDAYFRAMPEICAERPCLVTEHSLKEGHFEQETISTIDKARLYRHVLENRKPVVRHTGAWDMAGEQFDFEDTSLFAGSTTSKFKGVPLYPEFMALALWPELQTLSTRKKNPYMISGDEINRLNLEVFPHWIDRNITELARQRCYRDNLKHLGQKNHAPEMKLLERLVFFLASKPNCISHTIPDFSQAVNIGLREMIDQADSKMGTTANRQEWDFYRAVSEVLHGVIAYSKNLAVEARRLAEFESDDVKREQLLDIAAIHDRIPEFPAQTFREGLTAVWLCWIAIHLENPNVGLSLGRLDQVLYPLYAQDIASGRLTVDQSVELLCCLWLKIGDHVPSVPNAGEQLFGGTGSNQAITVGGVDMEGRDAVNDLTYVILRATELMKLRDPNLNARYFQGVNSRDYLRRVCEVNINTGATPALHNDRAVIHALTSKGETVRQARDYGIVGCVEPCSNGRHYGHTAAILMNLTSVLELTLFNGCHRHTGKGQVVSRPTGDPTTFDTFEDFRAAFSEQTHWLVHQATNLNNILGETHRDHYPTPILSAFFEGPVDSGKDLIDGGAVINSSGATIIGLADVADSLSAIETHVFDKKTVSFAELLEALEKDFEGFERLQLKLSAPESTPKYGNDDPAADANVDWLLQLLDDAFARRETYRNGHYRLGVWTMTNHAGFGRLTKALPNGRKDGENFSSGITPVSGVTPDLSLALHSVARQRSEYLSNGVALNLKYTPEPTNRERMLDDFVASVETYVDSGNGNGNGGMEIQFNIIDHNSLKEARDKPELYADLLVRVSGYTAYFKDLNPQMQEEIIDRTEYLLATGKAALSRTYSLPKRNTD